MNDLVLNACNPSAIIQLIIDTKKVIKLLAVNYFMVLLEFNALTRKNIAVTTRKKCQYK